MQACMCDETMSQGDISLLFAMRTKTVRNIRSDFGKMCNTDLCPLCQRHVDTIPALMECEELQAVPRTGAYHTDICGHTEGGRLPVQTTSTGHRQDTGFRGRRLKL